MLKRTLPLFFYTFCAGFLVCCHKDNGYVADNIKIRLTPDSFSRELCSISDIYKSIEIIPVDTTVLIGNISLIKYLKGKYYLLDQTNQVIHIVSREGKIENIVGSRGRAQNEYISLSNFDINPDNEEIIIYDQIGDKFITYSNSGQYLKSQKLDDKDYLSDFIVFNNGNILCANFDYQGPEIRRGVWLEDSNGNYIKHVLEMSKETKFNIITSYPLFTRLSEDKAGIVGPVGDDAIYHIDSQGDSETILSINYDVKMPRSVKRQSPSGRIPKKFYFKDFYGENKNYIYLETSGPGLYAKLIYNIKTKEYCVFHQNDTIIQDMLYLGIMGSYFDRDLCVCSIDALPDNIRNQWQALSNIHGTAIIQYLLN